MTHDQIKLILQDYLEGFVDEFEQSEIQNHLSLCTDCRNELAEMNDLVFELNAIPQLEPPADLTHRVMARVRAESKSVVVWDTIACWLPKIGYAYAFGNALVLAILSKLYLIYTTSTWSSLSYTEKFSSSLIGTSKGVVECSQGLSGLWIAGSALFKHGYPAISTIWIIEIVLMITTVLYYYLRKHKSIHVVFA